MKNIDQVKVRVRGHNPHDVMEIEVDNVDDAILWLRQMQEIVR
jgi:hypothetical protein